jgi:hypothetical protein
VARPTPRIDARRDTRDAVADEEVVDADQPPVADLLPNVEGFEQRPLFGKTLLENFPTLPDAVAPLSSLLTKRIQSAINTQTRRHPPTSEPLRRHSNRYPTATPSMFKQ